MTPPAAQGLGVALALSWNQRMLALCPSPDNRRDQQRHPLCQPIGLGGGSFPCEVSAGPKARSAYGKVLGEWSDGVGFDSVGEVVTLAAGGDGWSLDELVCHRSRSQAKSCFESASNLQTSDRSTEQAIHLTRLSGTVTAMGGRLHTRACGPTGVGGALRWASGVGDRGC